MWSEKSELVKRMAELELEPLVPESPDISGEVGEAMFPIDTAPKDGTLINLHNERGSVKVGSWKERQNSLFRKGFHWVGTDERFLEVPFDLIIGWSKCTSLTNKGEEE